MMKMATIVSLGFSTLFTFLLFFGWGPGSLPVKYLQFYKNLAQNDNHLNYANHEYAYNFMMSAEPNSIFMTEGGDNQVFSLLYFATAERKRPDIDFFDQKGNVFPRLYGDLLKTYPDDLRLIREIRDYQLFSTGRPIYLTWKREGLEKLNLTWMRRIKQDILSKNVASRIQEINRRFKLGSLAELRDTARNMVDKSIFDLNLRSGANLADQDFKYLGPWYYKRFGTVFRVTPIRYAILDGLDVLGGEGNYQSIALYVKNQTKINLTENQFDFYIDQLTGEGYVELGTDRSKVLLKKSFRVLNQMESIDYWDHYSFSHTNVYNAGQWDFLTREIFGSYIREQNADYKEQEFNYRLKANHTSNLQLKYQLFNKARDYNRRALDIFGQAVRYNYDNPYLIFTYGKNLYLSGQDRLATKYIAQASSYDYKLMAGYIQAVKLIIEQIKKTQDPVKKEQLKSQAKSYISSIYDSKRLLYASIGRISEFNQDKEVGYARKLEADLNRSRAIPQNKVDELEKLSSNEVEKIYQVIEMSKKRGDREKVIKSYQRIIELEPQFFQHYLKFYQYTASQVTDQQSIQMVQQSIQLLEMIFDRYDNLQGVKPPRWSLKYNLAGMYLSLGDYLIKNRQELEGKKIFEKSRLLYQQFEQGAVDFTSKPTIKARLEESRKLIQKIDQMLTEDNS